MRLLLDLAGVLARFDPEGRLGRLAAAAGLSPDDVRARLYGSGFVAAADRGGVDAEGVRAGLRDRLGLPASVADTALELLWASAFEPDEAVLDVVRAVAVPIGVLTNNDALLATVLPGALPEVFAPVDAGLFFAGAIRAAKPDPEAWEAVLRAWRVAAGEVVFVDDKPEYAEAATALGLHGVAFTTPDRLASDLAGLGLLRRR